MIFCGFGGKRGQNLNSARKSFPERYARLWLTKARREGYNTFIYGFRAFQAGKPRGGGRIFMPHAAMPGNEAVPMMLEILNRGESCLLTVTGSSMLPFLRHKKDAVLLTRPAPELLTRGRIVFFQRTEGSYVLHRIRRVEKDGTLCICGDAQSWTERIRREQVLAAVTAVRRQSGRFVDCGGFSFRICSALWYPTRPFREKLLRLVLRIRGNLRQDPKES